MSALFLGSLSAQQPTPSAPKTLLTIGDPAPALQFDHVLGGEAGSVTGEALRDKVVVIEFSTSWCGGCRAAAPHWNELAAAMAALPVVFLSVTNETLAAAEKYRDEVELKTPLCVDLDGSVFEAFSVGGVPDVVVIGKDGRIAAFTGPQALTAEGLKKVLAGAAPEFAAGPPRAARNWNHQQPLGEKELEPGTFSFRPSPKPGGMTRLDPKTGTIRASGLPCSVLLCIALDCGRDDLTLDPSYDASSFYDLEVRGADSTLAGARALAREGLLRELHSELTTKQETRKVLLLQRLAGSAAPPAPKEGAKGGTSRNGRIELGKTTASRLAASLSPLLQTPVIDESHHAEAFSCDLQWDPGQGVDGLRQALVSIGFTLAQGERPWPSHRLTRRS